LSSTTAAHNKLIAAAARTHLRPFGCTQKGRSRLWLLDRVWFVSLVEFQPSSFGKGLFLNVGAHFLWTQADELSFDLGYRVEEFSEYESDEQFAGVADRYAQRALQELKALDGRLPRPGAAAAALPKSTGGNLRVRLDRAISHFLGGETGAARTLLESLATRPSTHALDKALGVYCADLLARLEEPDGLRLHIATVINQRRGALGLPADPALVAASLQLPPSA
jgi:hypothetical protein